MYFIYKLLFLGFIIIFREYIYIFVTVKRKFEKKHKPYPNRPTRGPTPNPSARPGSSLWPPPPASSPSAATHSLLFPLSARAQRATCTPSTTPGDRQLCCCTTDQPVHSASPSSEPRRGRGTRRSRRRTHFRWRRHGSRSSSRCRPTRPPSTSSCTLSTPLLAGFLFLFCRLINCPALVTYWGSQPVSGFWITGRSGDVHGRGSARQQGRPAHRLAEGGRRGKPPAVIRTKNRPL